MIDPQHAAAARSNALADVADLLALWAGEEHADARALAVLDTLQRHGYRLPPVDAAAPYRGPGSTEDGRAAARAVWEAARRARRDRTDAPWSAVEQGQERRNPPPGYRDNPGTGTEALKGSAR